MVGQFHVEGWSRNTRAPVPTLICTIHTQVRAIDSIFIQLRHSLERSDDFNNHIQYLVGNGLNLNVV